MYDDRLATHRHGSAIPRDEPVLPLDDPALPGDDPEPQGSNSATAAGPDPNSTPTAPASPLMVGDEPVWGDELCRFAAYCKRSLTCCNKQILCHWCVFVPHYGPDKIFPSGMLLHCLNVHKSTGFKCHESGCMVRVRTPREVLLHAYFCHELRTGWWDEKKFKDKMEVMKTD